MSLIDSFSKPRWQHAKADVRKAAVAELDDQDILCELTLSDPDPEVQSLSLSRISSPDLLDKLIESLGGELKGQASAQRLKQLLPGAERLEEITDGETLLRIAHLTADAELQSKALAAIKDKDFLVQIATSHPQSRIRLSAAMRIEDTDLLRKLLQHSKNRDKAVYRHCKEQLDARQAAKQAELDIQEHVEQLAEKAKDLPKLQDPIEFKGRYLLIKQEWPALEAHASQDQKKRIMAALELGEQHQRAAEDEEAERKAILTQTTESQKQFTLLLAELELLDRTTLDHTNKEEIAQINTTLNGIEERWVAALGHAKPSAEQTAKCKLLLNDWRRMLLTEQRLLEKGSRLKKIEVETQKTDHADFLTLQRQLKETEKLIATFVWPESHISVMPEQIKQLHEQKNIIIEKLDQLKKNEKQNLQHLEEAFEKLREELKTNHFDNADREYRRLRNFLRRLNPNQQHHYQQELRPLVAKLKEIHDWQGFAIEPKKLDLIQRMQALVGSTEDPDVLAAKIKVLQKEWKALGHLAPHRDQELWLEFKTAADQAYEPCKEAFGQRAEVYKQNVKRRMELIQQLVQYEKKMHWPDETETESDYQQPDWKLVQKTLDTARQAFRNIKPVDRKGERKTQKKLKVACDRIYSHIKAEYERNIKLKEAMIEQARELVEMEDLQQAISRAKTIQREWKEIGMTPMRVDRKLWKKFRGACDAVFARLDEQRQQAQAAAGEQVSKAEDLLKNARELVKANAEQRRPHLKKELSELRASLRDIELPGRVRQQLNKQFGELEADIRNQVEAERKLKEQKGWRLLTQNIRACAMKSDDEKQANEQWKGVADLPKGIETQNLEAFWEKGAADTDLEVVREACIALEVLFEEESPAEDKQARMAYQMKRLVDGMGGNQSENRDQQLLSQINKFVEMRPSLIWADRFCSVVDSSLES